MWPFHPLQDGDTVHVDSPHDRYDMQRHLLVIHVDRLVQDGAELAAVECEGGHPQGAAGVRHVTRLHIWIVLRLRAKLLLGEGTGVRLEK